MQFEEDYSSQILKYFPEGETLRSIAKLKAVSDPSKSEILALTSTSVVKYKKKKNNEEIDQTYIRHITGSKLNLEGAGLLKLIVGIILLIIGGCLSPTMFMFGMGPFMMFVVPILLCAGAYLVIKWRRSRKGFLQIYSYDSEKPIVDARFSHSQTNQVIALLKEIHEILLNN